MARQTTPDIEQGEGESRPDRTRTPTISRSYPPQVSPSDTFDTALTSPSTFDSADTPRIAPMPQKISFDHNIKTTNKGGSRSAGFIWGIGKPLLGVTFLFLLAAAAVAYLLNGWLRIPNLNEEIEKLEEQVDILNLQVNRLSKENDRYAILNNELNSTVEELTDLTGSLNDTVVELHVVADYLNATNMQLDLKVADLTEQNENYAALNANLNSTALYLSSEVGLLKETLSKLMLENDALSNLTESLKDMKDKLSNITVQQNETLIELQDTLASFTSENDRLQDLNTDLLSIVGFLNETSLGIDDSLEELTGFLSNQIMANQALLIESLENTYRQRVAGWDCDYRDVFREQTFGNDFDAPITDRNAVLTYIDDRVLSELCLDKDDFDVYLFETFQDFLSSHRLIRGVLEYTTKAIDLYFPEENEVGLTPEDWADASFSCTNLASTFTWS